MFRAIADFTAVYSSIEHVRFCPMETEVNVHTMELYRCKYHAYNFKSQYTRKIITSLPHAKRNDLNLGEIR